MVKFSGDPSLTFDDLKQMFEQSGLKKIEGNVLIDSTIFDENHSAPGGFTWDDHVFYYAAPKSAIVVNKNCARAKMVPAARPGQKAQLTIEEPNLLSVENNVLTVAPRKKECEFKSRYLGQNKYEVYGCMFQDMSEPVKLNFALQDNRKMIIRYIEKIFKELNIQFAGKFIFKKCAFRESNIISMHESLSLSELLGEILSHSCNMFASALFKAMAAKHYGSSADYEMSEEILKKLLRQAGLSGQFILKDGSGESRHNMVTPEVTVNLLELIYKKDSSIKDLFIKSLAQYKSDGSLSTRSLGAKYDKYIYAKTGSSQAVSALAGYYLPFPGQAYAFAILINNHNLQRSQVKSLEDKILLTLIDYFPQHTRKK
jgi:D-alanyl-D-alanine carboxypeptidase/D-alanyl-D-alanine-endopeptidase (penicillin-binding protein 4)